MKFLHLQKLYPSSGYLSLGVISVIDTWCLLFLYSDETIDDADHIAAFGVNILLTGLNVSILVLNFKVMCYLQCQTRPISYILQNIFIIRLSFKNRRAFFLPSGQGWR